MNSDHFLTVSPTREAVSDEILCRKSQGSWAVGTLGTTAGSSRALRYCRQALPPPEGHRDGPGETISDNVLNSEDKLHSNSGASFVDSVPSALRES